MRESPTDKCRTADSAFMAVVYIVLYGSVPVSLNLAVYVNCSRHDSTGNRIMKY